MPKIKDSVGRFASLLGQVRNLAFGASIILAVQGGYLGIVEWLLPKENRGEYFLWGVGACMVVISFEGAYILKLYRDRKEARDRLAKSEDLVNHHKFSIDSWRSLQVGCTATDHVLGDMLQAKSLSNDERLRRCVVATIQTCWMNVLTQCEAPKRRLAYLAYDPNKKTFDVLAHVFLHPDDVKAVKEDLGWNVGLAGKALQCFETLVVHDTNDQEAAKAIGYKWIGNVVRHRTLAARAVWVNGDPVGVLCVDYPEPRVFTEDDKRIIERFTEKIALLYRAFGSVPEVGVTAPQSAIIPSSGSGSETPLN